MYILVEVGLNLFKFTLFCDEDCSWRHRSQFAIKTVFNILARFRNYLSGIESQLFDYIAGMKSFIANKITRSLVEV